MPTSGRDAYAVSSHAAGTFVWPPVYTALATTNDIRPTTCVYIRMAMDTVHLHSSVAPRANRVTIRLKAAQRNDSLTQSPGFIIMLHMLRSRFMPLPSSDSGPVGDPLLSPAERPI